jgi:lysophospholipase L1-like esterase
MKPKQQPIFRTIAFIASVFFALFIFMQRPKSLQTIVWKFPIWEDLQSVDSSITVEEVQTLLASYGEAMVTDTIIRQSASDSIEVPNSVDSVAHQATLDATGRPVETDVPMAVAEQIVSGYSRENAANMIHRDLLLQGNADGFARLSSFFAKLNSPSRSPSLHVFHFGDSQIEGDRITGELRSKWQKTWGGEGPGFVSPAQPIPSLAIKQKWSSRWNRYTRFGKVDSTIRHNRYGFTASFAQYEQNDDTLESNNQWVELSPHPKGFRRNQSFEEVHLLFGRTSKQTTATLAVNDTPIRSTRLRQDSLHSHIIFDLSQDSITANPYTSLKIEFEGESPEFHAIGLWSRAGIAVHNVAMRGSSGTLFRQLDRMQLKQQLASVRTELILLQYGGNAVPYLKDSAAVRRFGGWFASQIRLFQALVPGIPVIVLGPSDMCQKVGTRMQTYPILTYMRDVLRLEAVREDALYWDVYEVMGGSGSMAAWVESSPPLASTDHIHFTPKGAREIAKLFNKSIQTEWALWQNWHADQTLEQVP